MTLGASAAAKAQAVEYRLDPNFTRVHWEVRHFGTSTSRGRFDVVSGSLQFDRAQGLAAVSIVVHTASVNTGISPLDGILRTSYLHSQEDPFAYFVMPFRPVRIDAPFEVAGEFTLRSVSLPLTLRSTGVHCAETLQTEVCGADLRADIHRSDFGILDGLPFIGDEVHLVLEIEASRDGARNSLQLPK